ncbi:MAG: DUF4178 domain-containing protein [Deltaproteobacteria bacterium]|nr:DUF4178 domain-containing protein [Deltaproteobacteria bacterium]
MTTRPEIKCPSCGAPHTLSNPGIVMYSCEFCKSLVYWDKEKIINAGTVAALPEGFSRLYRGATGTLFNKRFSVLGRARYAFGRGFWDEWFVELHDGKTAWLSEDDHEFCLEGRIDGQLQIDPALLKPGSTLAVRGEQFTVEEVGQTRCLGIEGDLPKVVSPDESYRFADASSVDGKYSLGIELDAEKPTVYFGHWLKYASIQMDDEGEDWR